MHERSEYTALAATAAVVATTATVASVGMQAAKAAGAFDPKSTPGGGYVAPTMREFLFSRGTQDMLAAERSILDDALTQGKLIEPELYRALGLEPVYDRPEDPEFASLSRELDAKTTRLNEVRSEIAALKATPFTGRKGKYRRGGAFKRGLATLRREQKQLNRDMAALQSEIETRGAVGRRVVGFKPLGGIADPTGSAGGAFGGALDEFSAHLGAALSGKEPIDPTLKTTFDEKERQLRERLRRQMGPDYETSTAGSQALANLDRERSEAFAQYNTAAIGYFSGLAEQRASALSELTSGRMRNLMLPATFRAELGQQLEGVAEARSRFLEGPAEERAAQGEALRRQTAEENAAREARFEGLEGLLAGVSGAGPTVGAYFGGTKLATAGRAALVGASAPVGPPTRGLLGVGGKLGGGKIQSLFGG